jgi:16S rRNA (uracil1498-N3)-methyltransferase
MHRFHLPADQCTGTELILDASEARHARDILRVQRGERVLVLDGVGGEYTCQVRDCDRYRVRLEPVHKETRPPPVSRVTLLQALPRGKIIESIIQKATELGVDRIVPLQTERATVRLAGEATGPKVGKWQRVAVEAIKQCGSAWLPRVEPVLTPAQFLAREEPTELALIASLRAGSRHARECFRAFRARHGRPPRSVCVWVGPEGDFTAGEVAAIEARGAQPISLGPRVLRSETAAVYCLAIIDHELRSPD